MNYNQRQRHSNANHSTNHNHNHNNKSSLSAVAAEFGLIRALATNETENNTHYENPCETKRVNIYVSSGIAPQDLVNDINTNTNSYGFSSDSFPHSWFIIDFSPSSVAIRPTKYSLKHSDYRDDQQLRTWNLEGRARATEASHGHEQDHQQQQQQKRQWQKKWRILRQHINDESLPHKTKGAQHTWDIIMINDEDEDEDDDYYQQLRIIQLDKNASAYGSSHMLACGGFEVYGDLRQCLLVSGSADDVDVDEVVLIVFCVLVNHIQQENTNTKRVSNTQSHNLTIPTNISQSQPHSLACLFDGIHSFDGIISQLATNNFTKSFAIEKEDTMIHIRSSDNITDAQRILDRTYKCAQIKLNQSPSSSSSSSSTSSFSFIVIDFFGAHVRIQPTHYSLFAWRLSNWSLQGLLLLASNTNEEQEQEQEQQWHLLSEHTNETAFEYQDNHRTYAISPSTSTSNSNSDCKQADFHCFRLQIFRHQREVRILGFELFGVDPALSPFSENGLIFYLQSQQSLDGDDNENFNNNHNNNSSDNLIRVRMSSVQ